MVGENEIEDNLKNLGFTKNDSKVLITLCKYKILSPADIAKYSNVDRARVYDSLNRLIERGFIQKEPVKRGANYQIIPVEDIIIKKSMCNSFRSLINSTSYLSILVHPIFIHFPKSILNILCK